jgi:hypothetical protein
MSIIHGDEGICSFTPGVTVGDFFQDVGFSGECVVTDLDVHAKIRTNVEWRINVNQLDSALRLDLLTKRICITPYTIDPP